jgi:hypothetical protein
MLRILLDLLLNTYRFFVGVFDLDVPMCMCRTKEDELEELQLREELKSIDAALKKNKKVRFTVSPHFERVHLYRVSNFLCRRKPRQQRIRQQ